jgi:uncharacterized protein (TIGR02145 family)
MKKTSIYFIIYFCSLATLQGQIEQQNFPGSKEINTKRATFNLEELKVRWKKAALENCPGVPCVTNSVPGDVTNIVVTDGLEEGEVIVTFTPPLSDGGSPITEYEVEATEESAGVSSPTISSYSLKSVLIENITITSNDIPLTLAENTNEPVSGFVVSSIIRAKGSKSPITVKGLKVGVSYIFKVIAKNIFGSSPPTSSSKTNKFTPKVFACSAGAASSSPTLIQNTPLTNITHTTKKATGIGTVTGLPSGVTANWSSNVITISGTPTATGTFTYTIPLTGTSCSGVNATGTITVSAACGSVTSVTDVDGNIYKTVAIGTQIWMAENLRVRKYSNGTDIRFDKSGSSTGNVSSTWVDNFPSTVLKYGAYTLYAHDSVTTPSSNLSNYGYLYNWYAVKGIFKTGEIASTDTLKICPSGWHVPTDVEWTTLTNFLGGGSVGGKMKSTSSLWNSPNEGADNSSCFSALPGGYRSQNGGQFLSIGTSTVFWSATVIDYTYAWNRTLASFGTFVGRQDYRKEVGASVRCLKD